jgi:Fe-S cluster assembly protein SufD
MSTPNRLLDELQHPRAADPSLEEHGGAQRRLTALLERGLPGSTDEHWRYTNLRALERIERFSPVSEPGPAQPVPAPSDGFERLVVVDGFVDREHSTPKAWAQSQAASPALPAWAAPAVDDPDLRFAALGALFGRAPVGYDIASGDIVRLEVVHVCSGAAGSVYPQLHLRAGAGSHLTLVERLLGTPAPHTLLNQSLRLQLLTDAQCEHYRLHVPAAAGMLLDSLHATLGERARYRVLQCQLGAAIARSTVFLQLAGQGAQCCWLGLAAPLDSESSDTLVRVRHEAPRTETQQRYRAIAAGRGHASCDADVHVQSAARGARVQQSLRGLIDGKGAHVNLRPRLTINTDDIQASHGATTGQLDENLLFYLLSRGIDRVAARALLKWAFLGDVFGAIELPALRHDVEHALAARLAELADSGLVS